MTIALLVLTNGRDDLLAQTLDSFDEHVTGNIVRRVLHDDTGDREHLAWLRKEYGRRFHEIIGHNSRLGQDRAINSARGALRRARRSIPFRYVYWLEDDFLHHRDVDLDELARVLDEQTHLLQLSLKRHAWYAHEKAAGGTLRADPNAYTEVTDGEHTWCEHRRWFTHNPNLQRAEILYRQYPLGSQHEWRFSRSLCDADRQARFAVWGAQDAEPITEHIGVQRVGTGY